MMHFKKLIFVGHTITWCVCLTCCKKTPPQSDLSQDNGRAQQIAKPSPSKELIQQPTDIANAEDTQSPAASDEFSGSELMTKLGKVLSPSMLEALQKSGDLPEMQAASLETGGKNYVIGVHSDGGLVIQLGKDNALLAFGFALSANAAPSDEERRLLTEFVLSGQPSATMLDEQFEWVKIPIKTYKSKSLPKIHAIDYKRGRTRTLVFFDSTRVEMNKLLPASPETIDPKTLKQLRSLLKKTK